jgi:hypothetical protein
LPSDTTLVAKISKCPSAGKVMALVFWEAGVTDVAFMSQGTINVGCCQFHSNDNEEITVFEWLQI